MSDPDPNHWLNALGLPRLGLSSSRVVFSPELVRAISEISDLGGLGDLETLLCFNADNPSPPDVRGREGEIYLLRDKLRARNTQAQKRIREIFGLRPIE